MKRASACAIAVLVIACDPGAETAGQLGVRASPLGARTEVTLFAIGRTRAFEPFAEEGEISPGPPREAEAVFREIPEGTHVVDFAGWERATFTPPSPATFPSPAYCVAERGASALSVVSGGRASILVTTSPSASCPFVALDRTSVDAAYTADPAARWYGAANGENVALLALDGWGAGAQLQVDGGGGVLGLFTALPDTGGGARWPDAASWNTGVLSLTADGAGDALAYLIAKPGASPTVAAIDVTGSAHPSATARLRVTGTGGGGCGPGGCPTATTALAIEPTGWASTEGGFNSNHAELRCGDDGRGVGAPYELYPGLTFDLSGVPAGATLTAAELRVYQVRVDGNAPYGASMHEVVAEHVRYSNMWEADEVAAIPGTIGQRVVSTGNALGWRSALVTEAVAYELAASRTRVQLRLRFTPAMNDGDTAIDWAVFASNDSPPPNEDRRPVLVLTFAP